MNVANTVYINTIRSNLYHAILRCNGNVGIYESRYVMERAFQILYLLIYLVRDVMDYRIHSRRNLQIRMYFENFFISLNEFSFSQAYRLLQKRRRTFTSEWL